RMGEDRSFLDLLRGYSFIAPLVAILLAFVFVPVVGTCIDSLYREVTFLPRAFIGLGNYQSLASDPGFRQSLRFTVLFVLASVPLELVLGLSFALLLHRPSPARGALRACVLIPWAVPAAVSGKVFELICNFQYGLANYLVQRIGWTDGPVNWLGSTGGAFFALVAGDVWKTAPFVAILFLAGLSAIPEDLYRQAAVDRAGPVQRFARITLPLLRPVFVVALLFRTIDALRVFDLVFVLTGGGPGGSTTSLSLYGYDAFTGGDFGYGSAVSVVLFLIAFALSVAYVRIGRFGRELS
ncbi:MAG: transporter permease, partial [Deltaproteobacteria bacterium]|nr:transporter permease [Deltaproteobacteria bacterium]